MGPKFLLIMILGNHFKLLTWKPRFQARANCFELAQTSAPGIAQLGTWTQILKVGDKWGKNVGSRFLYFQKINLLQKISAKRQNINEKTFCRHFVDNCHPFLSRRHFFSFWFFAIFCNFLDWKEKKCRRLKKDRLKFDSIKKFYQSGISKFLNLKIDFFHHVIRFPKFFFHRKP